MHAQEPARCEQTIARVLAVMEAYQLETLHPNVAAQFYFQAAVVYRMQEEQEQQEQALANPAFAGMKDNPEYKKLMARIEPSSNTCI